MRKLRPITMNTHNHYKSIATLLLTFLLLFAQAQEAKTYYVSKTGSNTSGESWQEAWNELDQIDWSVISAGDTILLDGGAEQMIYTSTLTVEKSGSEGKPISIKRSTELGRNGMVHIFGGRETPLPYCGQENADYQTEGVRDVGLIMEGKSWVNVDGASWQGIKIYGHNRSGAIINENSSHILIKNIEVFNNGLLRQGSSGVFTDQPGLRLSGDFITVEDAVIYDNGQDAIQSEGLNNFVLRRSWLYNSRAHPSLPTEAWNYCTHTDGLQIYDGGTVENILIEQSVIGPGHTNGLILGQTYNGRGVNAVVNNVTLRDVILTKAADNGLLAYPNTKVKNWVLDGVTFYCENTKYHCVYIEGSGHQIRNSIFDGARLTFPDAKPSVTNNCQWNTEGAILGEVLDPNFKAVVATDFFATDEDFESLNCPLSGANLSSKSQLQALSQAYIVTATWDASSGLVSSPFDFIDGSLVQSIEAFSEDSVGKAVYVFSVERSGNYIINALVDAPTDSSNSFLLNINEKPNIYTMIWDIDITQGFEERTVSWRGDGSHSDNEFMPKVFYLEEGQHTLYLWGREANVKLNRLAIVRLP